MKWLRSKRGFTLIELIVVLAIIGLLAGLVVPFVVKYIAAGEKRAWEADRKVIQAAVDAYLADPDNPKPKEVGKKRVYPTIDQTHEWATTGADLQPPPALTTGTDATVTDAELTTAAKRVVIDFKKLTDPTVAGGIKLLPEVPKSAYHRAGLGTTAGYETGSYIWYIGPGGVVKSLLKTDVTKKDFQEVYP